jgi:cell shape-determining protein MreC
VPEVGGISQIRLSAQEVLARLEQIQEGLREVKANLHDSIIVIESESFEKLKFDAELKAENLELEVKQLREELSSIRKLLGANLGEKKPAEN